MRSVTPQVIRGRLPENRRALTSRARRHRITILAALNLVFSKWDQIFKDPMTTAAAIDRVVHHAAVLEFTGPSVRAEAAERRARHKDQP